MLNASGYIHSGFEGFSRLIWCLNVIRMSNASGYIHSGFNGFSGILCCLNALRMSNACGSCHIYMYGICIKFVCFYVAICDSVQDVETYFAFVNC